MNYSNEKLAASFYKLEQTERQILCGWIRMNLIPCSEPNRAFSSYALKHCFQSSTDIYVDNDGFKFAMLKCGFEPVDKAEENCHYCISNDSLGLKFRCI